MKIRITHNADDAQAAALMLARIRKDFPKAAIKYKDGDPYNYIYVAVPTKK